MCTYLSIFLGIGGWNSPVHSTGGKMSHMTTNVMVHFIIKKTIVKSKVLPSECQLECQESTFEDQVL